MAEVSADDISLINNNSGPYLILSARTVLDSPPGGNGNGRFDPGENGGLVLSLRNIGNQDLNDVTAWLRSTNTFFIITDSTTTYGPIPAGATRSNDTDPFAVQVSAAIPRETPVPLILFINGNDYCDTINFTITVGEVVQTDPIPDNAQPPIYWAYDDIDTLYPEHPSFSWVEINNLGTRLTLTDDQTVTIDLPFTWQFYGSAFNQISICSNGWVAPGYTTSTSYTNTTLPTAIIPGAVCINWDDLYPPTGNGVWYYYDPANHRFIVEWDSVHYLSSTVWEKFEIIIYDQTIPTPTGDNVVIVQYLTANNYTSSTIGIQNPTQTIAIQCLFDGTYHRGTAPIAPGRAIKFTTVNPTAITEENRPNLPQFRLFASPNPAKGTVRLTADLNTPAILNVYDQTGRLVRTITGNGSWLWNGKDENNQLVAPGVYFCRLKNHRGETKLILTR